MRGVARTMAEEWGEGLIRSWNEAGWIGAPARLGDKIARLIGAEADEVMVADSTSVNLFKLLVAGARGAARPVRSSSPRPATSPPTSTSPRGSPTCCPASGSSPFARAEVIGRLDESVAVVLLTHVHYKTAERWDMAALTAARPRRRRPGALGPRATASAPSAWTCTAPARIWRLAAATNT